MDAYVFQAALYCAECGEAIKARLDAASVVDSGDSDDYPQGPYPDGGGEADTPQHCDCGPECLNAEELPDGTKIGAFLENPLTSDGIKYVREQTRKRPIGPAVKLWLKHYGLRPFPASTRSDLEYRKQETLRIRLVDNLNSTIRFKGTQDAYIESKNRILGSAPKMTQTSHLYVSAYIRAREDVAFAKLIHAYRIVGRPETASSARWDDMTEELREACRTDNTEICLAWDKDGQNPFYGWKSRKDK